MDKTILIERLEKYNEKSEKLFTSKFNLQILPNKDIGRLSISIADKSVTVTSVNDFRDELDAFILTYRLFQQDNDRISIRRMYEEIYQLPAVPVELRDAFTNVRKQINAFLDSPMFATWPECPATMRELHDIVIYGELAHVNEVKAGKYKQWSRSIFISHAMWSQFAIAVSFMMTLIDFVQSLNYRLIDYLQGDGDA